MKKALVPIVVLLLLQSSVAGQTWSCLNWERSQQFIPNELSEAMISFGEFYRIPNDEVLGVAKCRYPAHDLDVLRKFKNLKYVRVSYNPYVSSCSEVLSKLPTEGIEYLMIVCDTVFHPLVRSGFGNTILSSNSGRLHEGISKFRNLKKLVLEGDFQRLPKSIANLKQMEQLELRSASLSEFPDWIYGMKKLKSLVLSGLRWDQSRYWMNENPIGSFTQIPEIPRGINKLKQLRHLEVWTSRMDVWPITLSKLKYLKQLVIAAPKLKNVRINQIENDFVLGLIHPVELLNISLPNDQNSITINVHDSIGLKAGASDAVVRLIKNKTVSKIAINSEALLNNSQIVSALSWADTVFIRKQPGVLMHIRQSKLDLRAPSQIRFAEYEYIGFYELFHIGPTYRSKWLVDTLSRSSQNLYSHTGIQCRYLGSEPVHVNLLDSFLFLQELNINTHGKIDFTSISDGHWEFLSFVGLGADSIIGIGQLLVGSPNIVELLLSGRVEKPINDSMIFCAVPPRNISLSNSKMDQWFVNWLNRSGTPVALTIGSCDSSTLTNLLDLDDHVSVEIFYTGLPGGIDGLSPLVDRSNWTVRLNRRALNLKSLKRALKGVRFETY